MLRELLIASIPASQQHRLLRPLDFSSSFAFSSPHICTRPPLALRSTLRPLSPALTARHGSTPNLHMQEGMVTELLLGANDDVIGVKTFFGVDFHAPAVVLTTGTTVPLSRAVILQPCCGAVFH